VGAGGANTGGVGTGGAAGGQAGHVGAGGANAGGAGAGGAAGGQAGVTSVDGGAVDRNADVPAPRLIAPLSTATVTSRRPTFHWTLTSGTDGAQIQICRDRACSNLVATFETSGDHGAPPAELPSGVLFWRAYGRTGGALGATPTATWEVTVGVRSASVDSSWGCKPDVNGDGFADLVIGAPGAGGVGAVHVYWGSLAGVPSTPSQTLAAPASATGPFGARVDCAGDVDGDGFVDVLVADQDSASGGTNHAYLFPGGPQGLASAPSATLSGSSDLGFAFSRVFAAGDVNGDGYADVIIAGGGLNGGLEGAFIYLGGPTGLGTTPAFTLTGSNADGFGTEAVGAGDINGDGYGDVVVSAPQYSNGLGQLFVYLGGPGGISATASATLTGTDAGGGLGVSLASAGDVNGDGYADLLVGGTGVNNYAGRGYVFLGGAAGLAATPASTLKGPDTSLAMFAANIAGGADLNADGYADVVFGTVSSSDQDVGHAYVYLGGSTGVTLARVLDGPDGPYGLFGVGLSLPGDVDGDGYADLAAAAPQTGVYVGTTYLYPGTTSGVAASPSATLT